MMSELADGFGAWGSRYTVVMRKAADFYINANDARTAILSERMFNLMHLESRVKVDVIVRKSSEFRQVEFSRRQLVAIAGIRTWIVSCEDLIPIQAGLGAGIQFRAAAARYPATTRRGSRSRLFENGRRNWASRRRSAS